MSARKPFPLAWRGSPATFARRAAWMLVLAVSLLAPAHATPSYQQTKQSHHPSDKQVTARDGTPIGSVRVDTTARRGAWLTLDQFSPALIDTVIAAEDARFFEHGGVDWKAVGAGAKQTLSGSRRGASTLTMQLVGLMDEDLKARPGGRSVLQKAEQARQALVLERRWTKGQILEAYLNKVPMPGEILGIPMASQLMFGKAPHGLNRQEAAILTALIRAPNASEKLVAQRACRIVHGAAATPAQCAPLEGQTQIALAQAVQKGALPGARSPLAAHLARRAGKAQVWQTTVDARLQALARDSLRRHVAELSTRNVEDGAVLVLDNATGEVLVWVGSSGALSDAAQLDFVTARRQAGSTLKPFVYAQALTEKKLTAASLIDDAPLAVPTQSGIYAPQNYDRGYAGPVSVRTALASSLNIPAVKAAMMVTPEALFRQLQALGFALRESGDYFGPGLALGAAEVSLFELTNAYRTLANQGMASEPRFALKPATPPAAPRRALSSDVSWIVADMLADREARARTFGLTSPLATRGWAAVKTGTSKDMRDNWCIGFSDRYTVGVWVGNASGAPMWNVSGVSGAAPVWAEVMRALHAGRPSQAPALPATLVKQAVDFGGVEPAREEVFLAGTERSTVALAQRIVSARITAPAAGTIVALDPDIPPAQQRVQLVAEVPPGERVRWLVNDRPLAQGARTSWLPPPGKYRIALVDAQGKALDTVAIEVRGAWMPAVQTARPAAARGGGRPSAAAPSSAALR
ncbi:penicillin-binding protein 1C [Piscinibacterium candidicorallinum]|uniref:peptidoglycan glycosyltransferase n=2 Tax=Piscinibacterium candidicorallinum TaxID=1793872 RepID=A0ABV7H2F7_9BURK